MAVELTSPTRGRATKRKRASAEKAHASKQTVQRQFMPVREIHEQVLLLTAATEQQREYRSVIEVIGTNFHLRSEEEQAVLVEGFRVLLKALSFPIQILIKNQRLDLTPYLSRLDAIIEDPTSDSMQKKLAEGHKEFVLQLASQRTLMERRFYIVVPTGDVEVSFSTLKQVFSKKAKRQARTDALEVARKQLGLRTDTLKQLLLSLGLHCKVLQGEELMALEYACFTPTKALKHPLQPQAIAAIGRPKHVKQSAAQKRLRARQEAASPKVAPVPAAEPEQVATAGVPPFPAPDYLSLVDFLSPSGIEESSHWLCVEEDEYVCGLAITDFPREVISGWFAPLVLHDEVSDVVLHIHPQSSAPMMRRLLRKRAEIAASKRISFRHGRLDDPNIQIAENDLERAMTQLAAGEEKILEVGIYILVRGDNRKALRERTDRMQALLEQMFVTARKTTFEQAKAFRSCLPHCRNELMRTITLDTMSLATAFPFISNSLFMPNGVLEGITANGELVVIDDWDERFDNPHRFVGAVTGAGKSYTNKVKIMREALLRKKEGLQTAIIDPEQEYRDLCLALGGDYIRLASGSEQHINPLELLPKGIDMSAYITDRSRGDRLAEKVQSLHALFDLMLADRGPSGVTVLTAKEKGLLDRAIYETYRKFGITADPRTHDLPVPLLRDLYDVLESGVCGKDEYGLTDRLYRFVAGSLAGPFSAKTDVELNSDLVGFDVRDMSGELRPIATWMITDFIWSQVLSSTRPRVLYIDEAWSLIQHPEGGRFLADLARRARKRYLRLVTITQSPELFIENEWGSVIASNAATKVLKKQDRTSSEAVSKQFQLTRGEQQLLLTLPKPEALMMAGASRVIIKVEASPLEHALATTDPRQLAALRREHQETSPGNGPHVKDVPLAETFSNAVIARLVANTEEVDVPLSRKPTETTTGASTEGHSLERARERIADLRTELHEGLTAVQDVVQIAKAVQAEHIELGGKGTRELIGMHTDQQSIGRTIQQRGAGPHGNEHTAHI